MACLRAPPTVKSVNILLSVAERLSVNGEESTQRVSAAEAAWDVPSSRVSQRLPSPGHVGFMRASQRGHVSVTKRHPHARQFCSA